MVTYLDPTGQPGGLTRLGYTDRTWDRPGNLPRGQLTTAERMRSAELDPGDRPVELPTGEQLDVDALVLTDPLTGRPMLGRTLLDRRLHNDALAVFHRGALVHESYRDVLTPTDRHVVHSCSKTLTTMMVGIAVEEGRLDPAMPVGQAVPALADLPAWQPVTLQHVLDMSAGIDGEEHYERPDSMYWRYADAVGYYGGPPQRQAGALAFLRTELTRQVHEPGTVFTYLSYLTNILPMALQHAYGRPAEQLYEERIYRLLGAEQPALVNLESTGLPVVEGQVNLTLRDFLRWGHLLLAQGRSLDGRQVVPADWVDQAFTGSEQRAAAFAAGGYAEHFGGGQYHNQVWQLEPGRISGMLGIHGQFCWVDRREQLMIVGLSSYPDQTSELLTATLTTLWEGIRRAVTAP